MVDELLIARAYHVLLMGFVQEARVLSLAELGAALGSGLVQAREALHGLTESGLPIWMDESGDVAALSPFSAVPTPHRVVVGGQARWYAI